MVLGVRQCLSLLPEKWIQNVTDFPFMTTANIIDELNQLAIDSSDDYARLDRLD